VGVAVKSKVWEVAILSIVVCLAGKLVTTMVAPFIPALLAAAIVITVGGWLYSKKRRW
jgi:hypothetical protein